MSDYDHSYQYFRLVIDGLAFLEFGYSGDSDNSMIRVYRDVHWGHRKSAHVFPAA